MRKALLRLIEGNAQHPIVRAAAKASATIGIDELLRTLLLPPDRRWQRRIALRNEAAGAALGAIVDDVLAELETVAQSGRPIVAGPWMSEVGYELLYWIPFLRWFVEHYSVDPARVTAVSRGGVASWYGGIAGKYADIFDLAGADAYRVANIERHRRASGSQKHIASSGFENELLAKSVGESDFRALHPELMYRLFFDYWAGQAGWSRVFDHIRAAPITPPNHAALTALPASFEVVKLYSSDTFPFTEERAAFARRLVQNIAKRGPVVLLNTGLTVDDHSEFAPPAHDNVFPFTPFARAADNLAAQTAIVARASRLVCTYGGFSYLPLFVGTPCVSIYATHANLSSHAGVVLKIAEQLGGSFGLVHETAATDL